MPLERAHHAAGRIVIAAGRIEAIAEFPQSRLQPPHLIALIARPERVIGLGGLRFNPQANPRLRQPPPVELLSGIAFALWRHVGMAQYAFGRNFFVTRENIETQSFHGIHLGGREFGVVEFVAGVVNLDADGAGVDIVLARPMGVARVPGAHVFGHHLRDAPLFVHQIVAGDF